MKKLFILLVLLCTLTAINAQDTFYTSGDYQWITLKSKYFSFDRKVIVRLPVDYSYEPTKSYNIVYVFDAQSSSMFETACSLPCFINEEWDIRNIYVGILSPGSKDYTRCSDFLPEGEGMHEYWGKYCGYADSLALFIKNELNPYILSHYRTIDYTIGVGHSLGASFVLYSMFRYHLFNDYIAMSPNMDYGNRLLAHEFEKVSFDKEPHFLFVSQANEKTIFGQEWVDGWITADSIIRLHPLPGNIKYIRRNYPDYIHTDSYPVALKDAYSAYFAFRDSLNLTVSKETYRKHIEFTVSSPDEEVYIVGNQDVLGNWDPGKIKMRKKNAYVREIDVDLHLPAQFKFTRGNWETEYIMSQKYSEALNADGNLVIKSKTKKKYQYQK